MTKNDVYVVVDTPKKAKKLKKVLEMFGETMFKYPDHKDSYQNGTGYGLGYGFADGEWQGFNTKWSGYNGKEFKKVSIKELRNILAKEHLKAGDYVVCEDNGDTAIGIFKEFDEYGFELTKCYYLNEKYKDYSNIGGCFDNFKRYATPEEIALLEPKTKELVVGKWYKNPEGGLFCVTSFDGENYKAYGFNIDGSWRDIGIFSKNLINNDTEATPQEVESALTNEAKRIGLLKKFVYFISPDGNNYNYYYNGNKLSYNKELNVLEFLDKDDFVGVCKTHLFNNGKWAEVINPEGVVGDWMFNPNSKKITQVKKDNHGKSLIGSGWIKIKDNGLIEKLNSLS